MNILGILGTLLYASLALVLVPVVYPARYRTLTGMSLSDAVGFLFILLIAAHFGTWLTMFGLCFFGIIFVLIFSIFSRPSEGHLSQATSVSEKPSGLAIFFIFYTTSYLVTLAVMAYKARHDSLRELDQATSTPSNFPDVK